MDHYIYETREINDMIDRKNKVIEIEISRVSEIKANVRRRELLEEAKISICVTKQKRDDEFNLTITEDCKECLLRRQKNEYIRNEQDIFLEENSKFCNEKYEEKLADTISCIDHSSLSQKKMKIFNDCFTLISRAFLLLSEDTNEVTADDIMQFTAFVFVLSEAKGLISNLEFLRAFNNINGENDGIDEYVITTVYSCIEYIKNRF